MRKFLSKLAMYTMIASGCLSCTGTNLYQDMASNKNSDDALYEDAQKLLDTGDYTGAINKILLTSATFQTRTRVKETLSGAYAARCGMVFLTFVTNFSASSAESFFKIAMNGFVGISTTNYADCATAESLIEGLGTVNTRTSSQNWFLMFLEMAKIGNRLRANADKVPAIGDGTVDPGFDCRTTLPIADARITIESFIKFFSILTVVGAQIGGTSTSQISDLINNAPAPTKAILLSSTFDYSDGTDPLAPDEADALINVSRTILNTQYMGIGSCNDPDLAVCVCPP